MQKFIIFTHVCLDHGSDNLEMSIKIIILNPKSIIFTAQFIDLNTNGHRSVQIHLLCDCSDRGRVQLRQLLDICIKSSCLMQNP